MSVRDDTREANGILSKRAAELGKDINDLRKESRSDLALAQQILRLSSAAFPTPGSGRIYEDNFVGQTFNGTNSTFTLTKEVYGQNILLNRVEQATGTLIPLRRTDNPAPAGTEFWFDDFFTVRVGIPPGTFDALLASYITPL